ncbi:hypothetical protein R0131_01210 [Clostridium sp. AL.422]|uniref:hypothetical protein n=1 Tax=Clostridium TaxID=1485 RepID=UPI00293DE405|nr:MULTISPECIES: hypothetical protein [unclassified Clostridium]MDV4149445.1 hypothetical protein [Clostridium sp. AL.422]
MKKIKRVIITFLVLSILIAIYCFTPTRITPKETLSENDIKIRVHLQVTTGPLYFLKEDKDKVWDIIKDTYPNSNPRYIKITGNTPNHAVNDPVMLGDFNLYGEIIGTYIDDTEGEIPLFDVKYSDAALPPIFRDDTYVGKNALYFLLLPIVILFLFMSLLIINFKLSKMKKS